MLDRSDWQALAGVRVFWPDAEDAAIDAILTLETIWAARHHGHAWRLDKFGEGASLVTLADLGLSVGIRSLSAVCPLHGRFCQTWSGALDERPDKIECRGRRFTRCGLACSVDYVREVFR